VSPSLDVMKVQTSILIPAAEKREELLQALRSLRAEVEREPGCCVCIVCGDVEGSERVVFVSGWESEADLLRHLSSDHYRVLSGASRLLGIPAEPAPAPPNAPSPSVAPP